MCQQSDAKLREYFRQETTTIDSIFVRELHVVDAHISEAESKFDTDIAVESMFTDEQTADQKMDHVNAVIENGNREQQNELLMDIQVNNIVCEPSDQPRYTRLSHILRVSFSFHVLIFSLQCS